jgi:hypothetical protein
MDTNLLRCSEGKARRDNIINYIFRQEDIIKNLWAMLEDKNTTIWPRKENETRKDNDKGIRI